MSGNKVQYFSYEDYLDSKESDTPYDKFKQIIDNQHEKYDLSFLIENIVSQPPRWLPEHLRSQFRTNIFF